MGILRTDKISGLETPTAVTGSVEFDGTGKDYHSQQVMILPMARVTLPLRVGSTHS